MMGRVCIPSMSSKAFALPRRPSFHATGLSWKRLIHADLRWLRILVKRLTLPCGAQSARVVGCVSAAILAQRTTCRGVGAVRDSDT